MGRLISEDAVKALIGFKVEAATDRITRLEERIKNETNAEKKAAFRDQVLTQQAAISALNVLGKHLRFIQTSEPPKPEIPISGMLSDIMPDMVLQNTLTGWYYVSEDVYTADPNEAFIFPFNNHHKLTTAQRMVVRSKAIEGYKG